MADSQRIELEVKVNQDTGQLEIVGQRLADTGEKAKKTEDAFSGLSAEAKKLAINLIGVASVAGVVKFFSDSVHAAEEENEALRRLSFNLEANGISWKKNQEAVGAWAAELQKTTRFSDTEAFSSLEKLTRVTGDLAQAQKAAELAMGLSVASGNSLSESQEFLINLINGNTRAVIQAQREYGAFIGTARSSQEILDILAEKFGQAAKQEESFTKSTKLLANAWDDVKEALGNKFIPALEGAMSVMKGTITLVSRLHAEIGALADKTAYFFFTSGERRKQIFAAIDENIRRQFEETEKVKTETVEKESEQQVRIIAKKSQQIIEEERKALETIRQANQSAHDELLRLTTDEVNMKLMEFQRFADERKRQIDESKLPAEEAQQAQFENVKLHNARINDLYVKLADDIIASEKKKRAVIVAEQKGELAEIEAARKKTNEQWLKDNEIAIAVTKKVANEISAGLGGAFADALVNGKDFAESMSALMKNLLRDIIQMITQLLIMKAIKASVSGGIGGFFAPGAGGAPSGATGFGAQPGFTESGTGFLIPQGISGAPGLSSVGQNPINVSVHVNLSTETLDLKDREAVMKALADHIAKETPEAILLALRTKDLADKNSGRSV